MTKFNSLFIAVLVLFVSVGCANRATHPRAPQQEQVAEPAPKEVERSVEVEEGSLADYTVRAGHATVEAAQATAEAADDAWEWSKEKKRRAKAWLHEATEEGEK